MSMRFEDFEYNGAATLKGGTISIEGVAVVSGRRGWEVESSSGHSPADSACLSGIFTANAPIPTNFGRLSYNIKNGCTLAFLEAGRKDWSIPCTIKEMEGERSVEILSAGY